MFIKFDDQHGISGRDLSENNNRANLENSELTNYLRHLKLIESTHTKYLTNTITNSVICTNMDPPT